MIDLLTLNCGCQWTSGSWDVCLFHRYKDKAMSKDGPIPLAAFDSEPAPIFNAPSMAAEPYEASTRQAGAERLCRAAARPSGLTAEREARKRKLDDAFAFVLPQIKAIEGDCANHCPTCTCKKER